MDIWITKLEVRKELKIIFKNKNDIKILHNDNEKQFEQYESKIGFKYLKKLLSSYQLDYFIHTWSVDKKEDIVKTYNTKNILFEKQIFSHMN